MVGVGIGVFGFSYWLLAYGWSQVRGQNAGFFELGWPGAYKGNTPDSGSGSGSGNVSGVIPNVLNLPKAVRGFKTGKNGKLQVAS